MPYFAMKFRAAFGSGDDGLPPFDGIFRTRDERYIFEFVATVRNCRWDVVVFAVVRKGALIKGFVHDLDLLFEEFSVGVLVDDGVSEDFDFTGVVTPADAESDASVGEDVGGCIVFGETERVPHGIDVESAAKT